MLGHSLVRPVWCMAAEEPFRGVVEWIHQLDVKFVEGDLGGLIEPGHHGDSPHELTADAEDRADHHLVLGARAGYPAQGVLRLTDQLPQFLIERVASEVATH